MSIESQRDFIGLSRAGKVVALALQEMKSQLRPGMTTAELDEIGTRVLRQHGGRSAPQAVYQFPGNMIICLNDEVVHGIPRDRVIHHRLLRSANGAPALQVRQRETVGGGAAPT
jgi:methionyl aminopeptidase